MKRLAILLVTALGASIVPCVADAQTTAFRLDAIELRDPHLFVDAGSCIDATHSFNVDLQARLQADNEPQDGNFDLSWVLAFRPLDLALPVVPLQFGQATCQPPLFTPTCGLVSELIIADDAAFLAAGRCLASEPGSVRPYAPGVPSISAPCFVSEPEAVMLTLGPLELPLRSMQTAATFFGNPPIAVAPGLIRGFLAESDASAIVVAEEVPMIGGRPMVALLPGGASNCAAYSDKDMHQGVAGWWVYIQYSGPQATVVEPDPTLFFDDFESS